MCVFLPTRGAHIIPQIAYKTKSIQLLGRMAGNDWLVTNHFLRQTMSLSQYLTQTQER